MVEFFNTQMGHRFIQGTMPRIADGLEAIAEHLKKQNDGEVKDKLIATVLIGLYTDGGSHKQFCLFEMAKLLGLDLEDQVAEGKLEPGRPG